MGNCLRSNNKVSAQDHEKHEAAEELKAIEGSKTVPMPSNNGDHKKKTVRFNLQEDEDSGGVINSGDSKSGVVRIRLMVTQEELKQLLNYNKNSNHSSLEQLLSALKNRGTRVTEVGASNDDESRNCSSWRPTLESIPEDQY